MVGEVTVTEVIVLDDNPAPAVKFFLLRLHLKKISQYRRARAVLRRFQQEKKQACAILKKKRPGRLARSVGVL